MKIRLRLLGSALAVLLASCRSVQAPAGSSPRPPVAKPHRVVLLSLDGAGAVELRGLYGQGKLEAGGFARFFRDGQVADALLPVDPSLTATNHISLATGYPADRTGIVANSFHPPGGTFNATANGFAAAIGTETLWEAARRQGKRVAVLTWPGADDSGPRRRGDWGMAYVNNPDRPPEMVTITAAKWQPAEAMAKEHGIAAGSAVRGAEVEVAAGEPGAQRFELLAAGQGVVVIPPGSPKGFPLAVGKWAEIPCHLTFKPAKEAKDGKQTPPRDAVCPVKLVALDLAGDTQIYFGGTYPLAAYPADFAAELAGRGLYWPGPPDDASLSAAWNGEKEIDLATWTQQSERFARFFGDTLVAAVRRPGWDLLLGYMPVIDEAGHQLLLTDPRQPSYAARHDACAAARLRVWQAVDRELARLLSALDLGTTTVVLVSDHGMSPAHTAVDPNGLLREQGLLAVDAKGKIRFDASAAYAIGSGGVGHLYLAAGKEELAPKIRESLLAWKVGGEAPVERVLTRQEAAALSLDHPNSGDLIVFFREGYGFRNLLREGKLSAPTNTLGMHGYLTTHPSMRAVYLAVGAGIPHGRTGMVKNPEVAGRVAGWLGIEKPRPEAPAPPAPQTPPTP
jgi:predicted AlkP superfamily pyrophosphatase or phosphodiesterase